MPLSSQSSRPTNTLSFTIASVETNSQDLPSQNENVLLDPSSYGLSGIATFQNDGSVELTTNPTLPTSNIDTVYGNRNLSAYPIASATLSQTAITITTREGVTYTQNLETQYREINDNLNHERAIARQVKENAERSGQQFNLSQMSTPQLVQYFQSKGAVVNNIGNGCLEITKTISVWGRQIVTRSIFNTATSKMERTEISEGGNRKMAFLLEDARNQLQIHSRIYNKYSDSISVPNGASDIRNHTVSITTSK